MKKIIVFFVALWSMIAFADRTDIWVANSVNVNKVELFKLTDGGCAVVAHGTYSKQDGGLVFEVSSRVEVAGTNRSDCLNILDTRAPVLFKNDKGL